MMHSLARYKNALAYGITLLLGIVLFYFAFRNQSVSELWYEIKKVNYWWSVPVLVTTLLNHWMRAYRWKLLITTYHALPLRLSQVFLAMMTGYFVNIAIPRLGEISRCATLKKTENVAFIPTLGSVITERLLDVFSLLLVVILVTFWQYEQLFRFLNIQILQPITAILPSHTAYYSVFLLLVATFLLAIMFMLRKKIPQVLQSLFSELLTGLKSFFQLGTNHLIQTILLTLGLWATYWLMSYLWFHSVAETAHLGIEVAFALLAVGSLARSVPIQGGGMGAYHFLTSQLLLVYGVATLHGLTLVTVIHAFQTIFYLLAGGISLSITFFFHQSSEKRAVFSNV
jgi:uncharacterized membrane protein YbhN (UPF0104 family)